MHCKQCKGADHIIQSYKEQEVDVDAVGDISSQVPSSDNHIDRQQHNSEINSL